MMDAPKTFYQRNPRASVVLELLYLERVNDTPKVASDHTEHGTGALDSPVRNCP
jgi:hypothetical protein